MPAFTAQRLQNQHIEYPQFNDPAKVLASLGAIQGQDYSGAKWSLGLRMPQGTDAQIEQAIATNQIVRTWLMRGTLFMTTLDDVLWLVDLVGARVIKQTQRRYKELELDTETLVASNNILVQALEKNQPLSRQQLYTALEDHGISTKGQRGYHILSNTSLKGLIVQGAAPKNEPFFKLLAKANPFSRDEALAELASRYFSSRGLATLHDFAWWSGLLMADVRAGLAAIRDQLEEEVIDGETYYRPFNATLAESPDSPTVYTPPGFDEYFLGYKNRDMIVEAEHVFKVCPGKNGVFFPTIVIDGQIRGVWKRTFRKNTVQIEATPFTPLTDAEEAAFRVAIERFGQFLEMPLEISIN